jgi:hypothetical protein
MSMQPRPDGQAMILLYIPVVVWNSIVTEDVISEEYDK